MITAALSVTTFGGAAVAAASDSFASPTFVIGLVTALTGLIGTIGTVWLAAKKKVTPEELAAEIVKQERLQGGGDAPKT